MIIQTINQSQFIDAFKGWDSYKDTYSYNGLVALYDYLDNLSDDINETITLDVAAITCDYTEYATAYDAMEQYQPEDMPTLDASDAEQNLDLLEIQERLEVKALDWLEQRTQVIQFDGGIIIQNF